MSTPRKFTLATAPSRYAKTWKNRSATWAQITEKLADPARSDEKDQGGYVGGYLRDGVRRGGHAERRSLLTLDIDTPADDLDMMLDAVLGGYAYALHETHSSTPEAPRYRLLVPLAADLSADEYVPAALQLMQQIGLESFDHTTAQPERLMYWPARPLGSDYRLEVAEGALLDGQTLLAAYPDWRDSTCWPEVSHTYRATAAKKAGDPREKPGIVGAFNRAYSIPEVIHAYLPEVYTEAGGGRWTYTEGHAVGGLAVYDDDTFAFSNHGTDPAAGQNLSAFDLVRVHLFGALDAKAAPDTPLGKLPSQAAMMERAGQDARVRVELDSARRAEAADDFAAPVEDAPLDPDEARRLLSAKLSRTQKGQIQPTADNLALILDLDPELTGMVGHDRFAHRLSIRRALPWREVTREDPYWIDDDDAGLRAYIETSYGIVAVGKIADALSGAARRASFHPVRDYLDGLEWDGTPRVETLLIDYLGAEDSEYTRIVARKALVAMVSRVREPGVKFDHMPVLIGPQGLGKSTFLARLGGAWFRDTKLNLASKDAYEALSGAWLYEWGEMTATKQADIESVKAFVSATEDNFRPAYGRRTEHRPRQVIFWGTTNQPDVLRDRTGNRRFWPVLVHMLPGGPRGWHLTAETAAQVWAEAVVLYEAGESLALTVEQTALAESAQAAHTEASELDGMVADYLATPIPADWYSLGYDDRRAYMRDAIGSGSEPPAKAVLREKVCASEVCIELLGERPGAVHPAKAAAVRSALDAQLGWSRAGKARFGTGYGVQVAWRRDTPGADDLLG